MGWVKTQINYTKDIFNDIVKKFGKTWDGMIGSSTCPYEYFADYIRDYYDVTLKQCDELCKMIKEYYGIKKFYYTEI